MDGELNQMYIKSMAINPVFVLVNLACEFELTLATKQNISLCIY